MDPITPPAERAVVLDELLARYNPPCPDCGTALKRFDDQCWQCPDNCGWFHDDEYPNDLKRALVDSPERFIPPTQPTFTQEFADVMSKMTFRDTQPSETQTSRADALERELSDSPINIESTCEMLMAEYRTLERELAQKDAMIGELQREMARYLPVIEWLEGSDHWQQATKGLGIATANGYRHQAQLRAENERLRNDLENARQDHQQADTDIIRALHERNELRAENERLRGFIGVVASQRTYEEMGEATRDGADWCGGYGFMVLEAREALALVEGGESE